MLNAGTYLGNRYEVLEQIGTGGMSDVYRAKDHSLDREVAIKVLKEEFAADKTFVTKFKAEAQSAAGLEHPNIVNIYDVGSEGNLYYIVMEMVEGITLKTYIAKKGQLSYNEVISIAIQVGRGIEAAHKKNIVHRDIKPQNIMISKEGKVKVTDFGIARAVSANTINADPMGSVHYASPEQARNGYITFQSDIYSLGIVMYEMCTGRVPYDGDTAVAVAIAHLQSEMTPPSAYAPNLPVSVEKIIQKCTMKNPDRRYDSIDGLLADLKKALVNPDEDFVTIPGADQGDATKPISEDELKTIQSVVPPVSPAKPEEDDEEEEDDDGPVNPKMDKAITIMSIAAAVVIIGIFIFLVGSVTGLFHFGSGKQEAEQQEEEEVKQVEVPDLIGLSEDEAKRTLEKLGLGYKNIGTESSDEYAEGEVIQQNKKAGSKVDENTTIKVKVSSGKGQEAIPNVVGQASSAAESALTSSGFKCVKDYQYSSSVAQDIVISQSPDAGTMAKEGDTVTIVISQGVESTKVPDVVGQSQSAATGALANAGFKVNVEEAYSDSAEAGVVISQSTAGGQYLSSGSTITITISKGAETVSYSFSQAVDPVGETPTTYTLEDANGKTLATWTVTTSMTLTKNDITTSTGTLYYDNGTDSGSQSVSFKKQ